MNKIESFIEKAYQGANGSDKKIRELKLELKNHLLETVFELKSEGKSEDEAIDIAIDRFGGEEQIRSIFPELFRVKKMFAKKILYIGLVFLMLAVITLGVRFFSNINNANLTEELTVELHHKLGTKNIEIADTKEYIESIVEDSMYINGIELKYKGSTPPTTYEYKQDVWIPDILQTDFQINFDKWYVDIDTIRMDSIAYGIFFLAFLNYWVLFAIWAIVNAYHQKRLNFGWILIFSVLNVVGYMIFRLVGESKNRFEYI
ncbi:permease prefix domain 1-containing protein [Virgibacillus necropolis]|uniref:permease prefix domain 1-containing protein n=1 Tax=Virgibacillus necropolis TaxID=163877 RepID=UPI0038509B3B